MSEFGVRGGFLSQSGAVATGERTWEKEGTRKGNKSERGRGKRQLAVWHLTMD